MVIVLGQVIFFNILLFFLLLNYCQSRKTTTTAAPGRWSTFGSWSECSKTCGIGVRRRVRSCSYAGPDKARRCKGNVGELKNCDTKITCPIDGGWSSWEAWKCTVTCGGGSGMQKRSCTNPKPMFGGKDCEGQAVENGKCNMQKCPDEIFTFSPLTMEAIKDSLDKEINNFEKNEGEAVLITCSPTAVRKIYEEYPKTSLMWTKNDKVLKIDHDRMDISPTELSIRKLTSNDNGIYVCSVHYAPQIVKPISVAAVSVTPSSPSIQIPAKQSMKLICHGGHLEKIFKNLTQKWLLNGQVYKDFGKASPLENSVYEIEDVKKNMSGKWSCRIKDPLSSREWTANVLIVEVLPPGSRFLSNLNVLLSIAILMFILIMLIGTIFAYMIIKTREEFMSDFEKWCEIVKWEEMKAGGVPKWAMKKEYAVIKSEESETTEEN